MGRNMRFAGIAMAAAGILLVVVAYPSVFHADDSSGPEQVRSILMLVVGIALVALAMRVGGTQVTGYALFLAVGLGSWWTALTTDDSAERLFGFVFGGIFIVVTILSLGVRVGTGYLKRFTGPITSALGPDGRLTDEMQAMALTQIEKLHGQGTIDASQLAAMQASLRGQPVASGPPPPEALDQLIALHGQGLITDEQLETIKHYWGAQQ